MKPLLKPIALASLFVITFSSPASSQTAMSKYEFGLNGGVVVYQGDLTPERFGSYRTLKPVLGLSVSRALSPVLSARFTLTHGKLYGNEAKYANPAWRKQRAFNFTTPITELSGQVVWSFLENKTPRLSPYIFTGAGLSFVKVRRDYSRMDPVVFAENRTVQDGLAADIAHPLPRLMPVIPIGAGVRYYLNDRLSITAETNYRFGFTDYLDGFSAAANPSRNDHYLTHSVGLVLAKGDKNKQLGCPVLKY